MATKTARDTFADALQIVYLPTIRTQFNLKAILLQKLGRNTAQFAQGQRIELKLHSGQSGGMGYSDTGALPAAGTQRYDLAYFNYHRRYATFEIDGMLLPEGRNRSAVVQPLSHGLKSLVRQNRASLNFELFGDGSGLLATPATATAARALTVATIGGLRDNMIVDIVKTADGSTGSGVKGVKITITRATKAVTIDPADDGLNDWSDLNSNASDYGIYPQGSRNQVIHGLQSIISASNPSVGNYGGIDRTAAGKEFWQGNVLDNGGVPRQISFPLIQDALDEIDIRSDGNVDLIICGHKIWSRCAELLDSDRRFKGDEVMLNGWAQGIRFAGGPVIVKDRHCPEDKMFLLDTSTFKIYQTDEGHWMDQDGSVLKQVAGFDAYMAAYVRYLEVVCDSPNCSGVITDLDTNPAP